MTGKKILLLIVALFCPDLQANTTGSWQKESAGGLLSVGRQSMRGNVLEAPASVPLQASATRIYWQVALLSPPPAGLKIQLCYSGGCEKLYGLSGQFTPKSRWPADESYYFVYSVNAIGQLRPPLRVLRNSLTMNYKVN
ncbi:MULTISPECIES: flagellar protein FlhE [Morganella]|jgi:flagellar protein FlhE|uniref:Flagellar protein FlhE n=2 Tax=Morganella morganii TaxID=582 RepID=A0AAN5S1F1_MORMO|nr:flagellar protein FlhE [Morganella morganii]EBW9216097.1 flagellar protein FlhE [Salmonella enterica subsp. enterica serovar Typhimurium]ECG4848220.1 flagellar protein FlhE [Salmonella enterica subsp. enterica serovar Newport]MCU6275455.1 flagellar protein FlhE [Morganella morganii]HAT3810669.1 flagellar protein FlhE [Morganella morganii]